jgi:hypothetical protein
MSTGQIKVGGSVGHEFEGPSYSACGMNIVKTSVVATVQQSYGQTGFGSGQFQLLGKLSLPGGIAGFEYQLLSIP